MNEKVLKDFETFEEFPSAVLEIKPNTNLVYIEKGTGAFIAREVIKKASGDDSNVEYELKYRDVVNNKVRLTAEIKRENGTTVISYPKEPFEVYKVIHLDEILKVKQNSPYYFTLEDIKNIDSFKEQEPIERRKYYF